MSTAQNQTYQMIEAFVKNMKAPGFLSGLFQIGPDSFHNQKRVHVDTSLEAETVAVPVADISSSYNNNTSLTKQEVEVIPPVFKEAETISVGDLYDRQVGMNPYEDNEPQVNGVRLALKAADRLMNKLGRALELQAAQILTRSTGIASIDSTGATVFALNYNLAAALFPTASTPWSTSGTADPITDLGNLCAVIRGGGNDPMMVVMDGDSFEAAMNITSFKERFTAANVNVGALNDMGNPGTTGGNFRGRLQVGHWTLDVYTYGARYIPANSSTSTLYIPRKKCVVLAPGGRKATFGGVPRFPGEQQALQYLPSRIMAGESRMDVNFNAWFSTDRESLTIGCAARPLLIPVDKFSFGCLDTDLA